jgi:DNA repair protein SbcD/Mre11
MTPECSSSLRIAHVADLHLGAGYVHGDEDRGGVNSRLVDFRAAWVRSCRQMVEEGVDLVLFAGDAFRDAKPTPTEQAAFQAGLDVLSESHRLRLVAVTGNHDIPRSPGRTHALAIFDEYRDFCTVVDRPMVVSAHIPVACFPWPQRSHIAAADPEFEKLTLDEQNARIVELSLQVLHSLGAQAETMGHSLGSVLVAHGSIAGSEIGAQGSTQFLREPVLPLPELQGLPFRYQAWGHLHKKQDLTASIRYAGSIERVDFSEQEDKGWWLLELAAEVDGSRGHGLISSWRSSNPRPFVDLELPDPAAWEHSLAALNGDVRNAVVRVRYQATPEVARTVDHGGIRRAIYAAGAAKVHGPFAEITHTVTTSEHAVDEQTSPLSGWREWARLNGIDGDDFARLDARVLEALEVQA